MLTLTYHAQERIAQRSLSDDEIAAALAGRVIEGVGDTSYYDPHSRTVVVTRGDRVITAYRMQRKQVKRHLSR